MAEAVSPRCMTAEDRIKLESFYLLILMEKLAPGLVFLLVIRLQFRHSSAQYPPTSHKERLGLN